ncbi:MAG TPA: NifB/NifX family molybdenum-iron cluster-binding protein [Syntrophomonas sp.]|nr:NifB/NifX family molybdenum-iron cluster-binding protein [Syntrophomonas sp.]
MLIAIPAEANMVCPHFGHCEVFAMYDTDTKALKSLPNPGHEPGFLPVFLKKQGVHLVIAGGMGGRAQELFAASGIELIVGVSGSIQDVIALYEKGELKSTGAVCSDHSHAGDCHH